MKKFFAIACMMLMSTAMFAQDNKMAVGVNLGYGLSDNYKPFGIGARFQYEFVENIRAEVNGNFWFPKDDFRIIDANLNFAYLIPLGESVKVYPTAGVGLLNCGYTGDLKDAMDALNLDTNKTMFSWNVGAGIEYAIAASTKIFAEVKYQYAKSDEWKVNWEPITVGVAFSF